MLLFLIVDAIFNFIISSYFAETMLTIDISFKIQTLKRLHEEQMRSLYVSEQQKQSELRGEYTAQVAILKENVTDLETQVQKHKVVG